MKETNFKLIKTVQDIEFAEVTISHLFRSKKYLVYKYKSSPYWRCLETGRYSSTEGIENLAHAAKAKEIFNGAE